MKKYFSKNIVFICWFLTVLNTGIVAQSVDSSTNKTIEQRNLLNQITAGENYNENTCKYYEKILEEDSTNYDALTNLGVIYQQKNVLEKSLNYFEKVVKFHPQKARSYHNLGILNSIIGNLDEAVVNLQKAAELDSNSPNSIRQLGIIYLQNEMYYEAIESFQRALNRDKLDTESWIGKALAYWSLEDYDKVLAEINEMQTLGLRFNRMDLLLADVYFKIKDYKQAMKYARLDETEYSARAEGHYLLGVLYKMTDEKDKAEFEFEEASAITQQNPTASLELSINIFFNAEIK